MDIMFLAEHAITAKQVVLLVLQVQFVQVVLPLIIYYQMAGASNFPQTVYRLILTVIVVSVLMDIKYHLVCALHALPQPSM